MPSPNYWTLLERLTEASLPPSVATLVDAALQGGEAWSAARSTPSGAPDRSPPAIPPAERPAQAPAGAFLGRVEVEGFRGIGPRVKLDIPCQPGLTLVVGRNGSGKSSIAEGFELLLTGQTLRWEGRTPKKDWQSGWRNLHHQGPVQLAARCHVEGHSEPVTLLRAWSRDDDLDEARFSVRAGTQKLPGLGELAWQSALTSCRPFLSHNELASALDKGPSKLFDAFDSLLGLDDVAQAIGRLDDVRKALERSARDTKKARAELVARLSTSEDPRAAEALACFGPRKTLLDPLETLVLTTEEEAREDVLRSLRRIASLRAPSDDDVLVRTEALSVAIDTRLALEDTDTHRAEQTLKLLQQALPLGGPDCPLCEAPDRLDDAWRRRTEQRIAALADEATTAKLAQQQHREAVRQLERLVRHVPAPPASDLPSAEWAAQAHARWLDLPDGASAMLRHCEATLGDLQAAYAAYRSEAAADLEQLQTAWRPLQRAIASWLERARADDDAKSHLSAVTSARDWLRTQEASLRDDAFRPIAQQAQETWEMLRQQSNVSLGGLKLAGTAKRRHVDLDITVDGAEGVALGVMSQGELHALALSLFLPRLTRPDSPFRFVVIDDPVQAMDPAKVDGLARVLERAAQTHQVIVFTHDGRLRSAVERLKIDASVYQVRRHPDSRVEISPARSAIGQHLSDAEHLSRQERELGPGVVRRVVPGLCRAAVEAAFVQRAWTEQLHQGRRHRDIEHDLAELHSLTDLAAFAFYGSRDRGGDVLPRLDRMGGGAAATFKAVRAGAHAPLPPHVDLSSFIRDARRLAQEVRR